MKLMWFHLMPYTELPDDFREKHPSVWVDIHSTLFDPRRAHHMSADASRPSGGGGGGFSAFCSGLGSGFGGGGGCSSTSSIGIGVTTSAGALAQLSNSSSGDRCTASDTSMSKAN